MKLQCFAVSDFVEFESHYSYHELNVQNMCEYVLMNKKVRNISLIEETA